MYTIHLPTIFAFFFAIPARIFTKSPAAALRIIFPKDCYPVLINSMAGFMAISRHLTYLPSVNPCSFVAAPTAIAASDSSIVMVKFFWRDFKPLFLTHYIFDVASYNLLSNAYVCNCRTGYIAQPH
jgi:hypothetical protein